MGAEDGGFISWRRGPRQSHAEGQLHQQDQLFGIAVQQAEITNPSEAKPSRLMPSNILARNTFVGLLSLNKYLFCLLRHCVASFICHPSRGQLGAHVDDIRVCDCVYVARHEHRSFPSAWYHGGQSCRWFAMPSPLPMNSLQLAQSSSRLITKPGKMGSAEMLDAGAIRCGVSAPACWGPHTSTACSSGISSQPSRAPLRW